MEPVKGDFRILRTLNVGRRANQGALTKALIGTEVLDLNSESWGNYTAAAPQDITLPDATTLTLGWSVVVNNQDTTNAIAVKDGSGALSKSVVAGRAYRFTCTNIGSVAGGWHKDFLEEADLIPAEKYAKTFNATTDWGVAAAGYYTITLTAATHLLGTTPMVLVYELNGSDFDEVICDQVKVKANGDVAIRVTEVPDARFAGRMILV